MKVGQFIYPWGNGHYSRMSRLDHILRKNKDIDIHYYSGEEICKKILEKFPQNKENIHTITMPTPIDGKTGPSVSKSLLNFLLPIKGKPPLVKQISSYLKKEAQFYDKEKFDIVINDGDIGSNILAQRRNIPSLFITNQFKTRLWRSRMYLYPSMYYISKQIAKATKIIVADSPPPYTICEYNLNFSKDVEKHVIYSGHFAQKTQRNNAESTILEKLITGVDFGYWVRTGNKSTNEYTGERYEKVFHSDEMKKEKRLISHAVLDPNIDSVLGMDGNRFSVEDAWERKIEWIQIDIGFLSENEKDTVLSNAKYVVVNGSHTIMGEVLGINAKPIIGVPLYDEHTNQLLWAESKGLGIMAQNEKNIIQSIARIHKNYADYETSVKEFSKNFVSEGAKTTAAIMEEMLKDK